MELGRELKAICGLVEKNIAHLIKKEKFDAIYALSGTNGWIISYIFMNKDVAIYQKDIERQFNVTRSTASKVLNLMEQKGLIKRMKVSHDSRLKQIILTEKSEKIAKQIICSAEKLEEKIIQGFTEDEAQVLYGFLERIKLNLTIGE